MTNPQFPSPPAETKAARPSGKVLAGAGSMVAVLAFLGGMAVGHAWDGSSSGTNQFGGPRGGGFRQMPGQNGQGGVPQQGQGQQGQGQQGRGQQGQGQPG